MGYVNFIRGIKIRKPNKAGAEAIRGDLKALGIKANVRFFSETYRIVLPAIDDTAKAGLRDYLVEKGFILAGSFVAATDRAAYDRAWATHDGRGQIFVYAQQV
jgi:hypothetical protein